MKNINLIYINNYSFINELVSDFLIKTYFYIHRSFKIMENNGIVNEI